MPSESSGSKFANFSDMLKDEVSFIFHIYFFFKSLFSKLFELCQKGTSSPQRYCPIKILSNNIVFLDVICIFKNSIPHLKKKLVFSHMFRDSEDAWAYCLGSQQQRIGQEKRRYLICRRSHFREIIKLSHGHKSILI